MDEICRILSKWAKLSNMPNVMLMGQLAKIYQKGENRIFQKVVELSKWSIQNMVNLINISNCQDLLNSIIGQLV